jgi:hypothetical protein
MRMHAWRNIFFFEGLFTTLVGLGAPFLMPRSPTQCWFLNERERMIATQRLVLKGGADENEKTEVRHVKRAMMNITNYFCALGFFMINITVQGISLFMVRLVFILPYHSMLTRIAYYSKGSWMDSHKGSTILSTSLRLCLRDRYCGGLAIRQDESSWYISRHLHASCYCRLCHYAMGHRS